MEGSLQKTIVEWAYNQMSMKEKREWLQIKEKELIEEENKNLENVTEELKTTLIEELFDNTLIHNVYIDKKDVANGRKISEFEFYCTGGAFNIRFYYNDSNIHYTCIPNFGIYDIKCVDNVEEYRRKARKKYLNDSCVQMINYILDFGIKHHWWF